MKKTTILMGCMIAALSLAGCGEDGPPKPKTFISASVNIDEGEVKTFLLDFDKERFKCSAANNSYWGCEWTNGMKPGVFDTLLNDPSKFDPKNSRGAVARIYSTGTNNLGYSFSIDAIYLQGNGKQTVFVCEPSRKCAILAPDAIEQLPPDVMRILAGGESTPFIPPTQEQKKATWDTAEGKPELVSNKEAPPKEMPTGH